MELRDLHKDQGGWPEEADCKGLLWGNSLNLFNRRLVFLLVFFQKFVSRGVAHVGDFH